MNIPEYAVRAIKQLEKNGFEAYLVGGCVRDFIMGIEPHDFDITTNAMPEQIKSVFSEYKTISSGEKHGTEAIVIDGNLVEITTYRTESGYTDNRHPDAVHFSSCLEEDLRRRDFTMNAIAMDINGALTDPFNGQQDIVGMVIRTVGDAGERFSEDALRILRALRFSSMFGFEIESSTSGAILENAQLLKNISAERIRDEFEGILCGRVPDNILRKYREVIAVFIPEIRKCFDFEQHTPYHKYDVWEHIIHAVKYSKNTKKIRTAMFFHDISKPECYKQDENGQGHFKRHAQKSAVRAKEIMKRFRFPNSFTADVTRLIYHHSDELNSRYEIKRLMGEIGVENTLDLIDVQRADSMSKQEFCRERLKKSDNQEKIIREIADNNECISLNQLDISGSDIVKLGVSGRNIGEILNKLLDEVMRDEVKNDKKELIYYAKSLIKYL